MYLSSISIELGKGVLDHNNRKFIAENVDRERTKNNVEYKNIPLEDAYHILFDGALQRYNDKQKRADRKIDNYLEHIQKSKQEKPFYEIIVQVGNRKDMGIGSRTEQLAKAVLEEYMYHFDARNPYLFVFNATLHMDEATPHLHIDFIPFTTESKRGLDTRVSMKQALERQGCRGSGRSDTETMAWLQSEKEALAYIMKNHGIEWENQGNNREHLSVLEYKREQRSKEVAELEDEVDALKTKAENLTKAIDTVTEISNDEEFEKEFTLPEPQRLESAKSYKGRIEGIFNKLKAFVKKVFVELMESRSLNAKLYNENTRLGFDNIDLQEINRNYQKENHKLHKQLSDYRLLRKILGSKQVDQLLETAKHPKQNERNYENDGVYLR
ncbi:MAG: plasmid recombination protein [Eubacterium sp.]|nr:plasmid recombination protein [Eubacterium sp.]